MNISTISGWLKQNGAKTVSTLRGVRQRAPYREVPLSVKVAFVKAYRKLNGPRDIIRALMSNDPWPFLQKTFNINNWTPIERQPITKKKWAHPSEIGLSKLKPISAACQPPTLINPAPTKPFEGTPLDIEFAGVVTPLAVPLTEEDAKLHDLWGEKPSPSMPIPPRVATPVDERFLRDLWSGGPQDQTAYSNHTPPTDVAIAAVMPALSNEPPPPAFEPDYDKLASTLPPTGPADFGDIYADDPFPKATPVRKPRVPAKAKTPVKKTAAPKKKAKVPAKRR